MITAHATIASAVEAMRLGAFDYLEKPFDAGSLEQRRRAGDGAPAVVRRRRSDATASGRGDAERTILGMVGDSAAMEQLRQRIRQVAPTDETVLICGESGTGKELVARAIHAASRRAGRPLVSLNCPALSPQLAESELFGHRRGAFTGADADRTGRFELAAGGTIFLDEITEIDLPLQAKLLRVLQERTFEPVGSSETRTADVRVIASTNRDLAAEIAAGRFREDLYYRLAVVPLELPPLRQRGGDVHAAGRPLSGARGAAAGAAARGAGRRRPRVAGRVPLAGQRARAGEPHHAGVRAEPRRGDRRRRRFGRGCSSRTASAGRRRRERRRSPGRGSTTWSGRRSSRRCRSSTAIARRRPRRWASACGR